MIILTLHRMMNRYGKMTTQIHIYWSQHMRKTINACLREEENVFIEF